MALTTGSALREAMATIRANPWRIFGLLNLMFVVMVVVCAPAGALAVLAFRGDEPNGLLLAASVVALGLGFALPYIVFQAGAQILAVDHRVGRGVGLARSLRLSLRRILPLVGAGFLVFIGYMLGILMLIVPGLIFLTGVAVTAPVILFEDAGPVQALGRSWTLTEGSRWTVFGAFAAVYLLSQAGTFMAQLLLVGAAAAGSGERLALTGILWGVTALLFYLVYLVSLAFYCVLPAVFYVRLKEDREGVEVGSLAAVFE